MIKAFIYFAVFILSGSLGMLIFIKIEDIMQQKHHQNIIKTIIFSTLLIMAIVLPAIAMFLFCRTYAYIFVTGLVLAFFTSFADKLKKIFFLIWDNLNSSLRFSVSITAIYIVFLVVIYDKYYHDAGYSLKQSIYWFLHAFSLESAILCLYFIDIFIKQAIAKEHRRCIKPLLLSIVLSIGLISEIILALGFGNTQVGSYFEKKEYEGKYVVMMSREKNETKDRKKYYLPAEIYKYDGKYHINYLYFNNGGYLTFEDYNEIYLNHEKLISDVNGDDYYIQLTSVKADK